MPNPPTRFRFSLWAGACGAALGLALACGSSPAPLEVTFIPPATAIPASGSREVLQVTTHGGGTPTFQWFKNDQVIPGATSATLVLVPVAPADAGSYRVLVTDGSTTLETAPFDLAPVEASWVVTSSADSGPGTLRDILTQANGFPGSNGIEFALGPGPQAITLLSPLPAVTGRVTILGPYGSALTVDGGGACRPLFLDGGTLVLDNFTLANGLGKGGDGLGGGGGGAGMGGALFMNGGSLSLVRMTFQGNRAVGGSSFPGSDGENGGGGGFGGDSPASGGHGADGGLLGGVGGDGYLDGSNQGGGPALEGSGGGGGGAARGGLLSIPLADWQPDEFGGEGSFGGGGGFSVGPLGGGGASDFGGGGGGSGGSVLGATLAGSHGGES
ncbi:MAG: immunoglobulin domain-containing protein, partial [Holophaga sp.]|nr:immunoglobulin domain-containing protein [Holophaga sp.]